MHGILDVGHEVVEAGVVDRSGKRYLHLVLGRAEIVVHFDRELHVGEVVVIGGPGYSKCALGLDCSNDVGGSRGAVRE